MSEPTFLLKIFAGPHSGAEIPLASDIEVVIGQDEECDFVLNDPKVSLQHLKLTLHDQQVILQPLDGDVYVNAKKIDVKGERCSFFDLITVGATVFAIGRSDVQWPDMAKLVVNKVETSIGDLGESEGQPLPLVEEAEEAPPQLGKTKAVAKKHFNVLYQYIAMLVVAIFVIAVAIGWYFTEKNPPLKVVSPIALIEAKLTEAWAKNVTIKNDASGKLILQGYVKETLEKEMLRTFCLSNVRDIKFDVYAESELLGAIQDTIDAYNLQLNVTNLGAGNFSVEGITEAQQKVDTIIADLMKDMPSIKQISNKTTKLKNIAINEVAKLDVDKEVKNDIVSQANTQIVENNISKLALPNISVLSITEGKNPYITTKNGFKLFKGAYLSEGYRIKDIRQQYIVLEKNNIEYIHYMKGA